jgi:hypothetical protein
LVGGRVPVLVRLSRPAAVRFSGAFGAHVPGYSHYNFVSAPELAPIIDKYLAGAAAVSHAAPETTKSS